MKWIVVLLLLPLAACATRVATRQCEMLCRGGPCIELIAIEGCPDAAEMAGNLCEAARALGLCCCLVDPAKLPPDDPRRRYPSPTILVEGKDLFGLEPMADAADQCRQYPGGLPDADAIGAAIAVCRSAGPSLRSQ